MTAVIRNTIIVVVLSPSGNFLCACHFVHLAWVGFEVLLFGEINNLKMQQTFTRIESGDNKYYLLTNLFNGGKDGFDLTVCNGEQVWRETGTLHIIIWIETLCTEI